MGLVKFLKGSRANYDALVAKDSETFYNTDDNKLFLGEIPLAGGTVTVKTATSPTAGSAKTYEIEQDGVLVGKIDIPSDMVISSGEVRTLDSSEAAAAGVTAGTYIVLTVANTTQDKLYINVGDLVDIYTVEASATQIQLAIDPSKNEISATIVAGSVTATELGANAVETSKIKDQNVTKAKLEQDVQDALSAMYWGIIESSSI